MLFSPTNISECVREWDDLEKGYQQMQDTHRLYKQKLEEVTKLQNSCSSAIARQRKKLKELTLSLKALYLNLVLGNINVTLLNKQAKPDGALYQMFRNQFLSYNLYQSFVQFLQYYYQSGCLYRLRALGERHNMDLTVVLAALQQHNTL
uniref:Transmembrane protein 120A n=1 Tax=Nothobranchius korthausae TaxID=1143690 RepID=A0A1A8FR50_9TELE